MTKDAKIGLAVAGAIFVAAIVLIPQARVVLLMWGGELVYRTKDLLGMHAPSTAATRVAAARQGSGK